jgi:hypothetical protein
MKNIYIFISLLFSIPSYAGSHLPDIMSVGDGKLALYSDDANLNSIFAWAVNSSDKKIGNDNDAVGPWYEAALPSREAFCMRDVSHQCMGEEINGHGKQNLNMMSKFAENISRSKDYCSYWEINRYNKPCPADYVSDDDFWYNLNANFDVMQACLKLYLWTGETKYISSPIFSRFYNLTVTKYIDSWQLSPEQIMQRNDIMNNDTTLLKTKFPVTRGLPSYMEQQDGIKVSSDLIAAIYCGLKAYAYMQKMKGNDEMNARYSSLADKYADLYNSTWFNAASNNCYAYCVKDKGLMMGDNGWTSVFPLWFGICNPKCISQMLDTMEQTKTNIENITYYSVIYYKYGRANSGLNFIYNLYKDKRRDYPEVASAIIEGFVRGMAGVDANYKDNMIITLPQIPGNAKLVVVKNIHVFDGYISVLHDSNIKTVFVNNTGKSVVWRAAFQGKKKKINGKTSTYVSNPYGMSYSYIDIPCQSGKSYVAK